MGIIPMSNVASGANWQKKSPRLGSSHIGPRRVRGNMCGNAVSAQLLFLPETETNAVTGRFLGSYETLVVVCLLLVTEYYGLRSGTSVQGEIHSHFHTICIHH